MNAKEYLRQIKRYENSIRTMKQELLRLRISLESAGGSKIKAAVVQYKPGDAIENGLARIDELEQKIQKKIIEYESTRERIVEEILSLPDPVQAKTLYMVYVEGLPIWKIAQRIKYSDRQVKRIHGRALKSFYSMFLCG